MSSKIELVIPKTLSTDKSSVYCNLKVLLALNALKPAVQPTVKEGDSLSLSIGSYKLIEANAIVRYLTKSQLSHEENLKLEQEEKVLRPALVAGKLTDYQKNFFASLLTSVPASPSILGAVLYAFYESFKESEWPESVTSWAAEFGKLAGVSLALKEANKYEVAGPKKSADKPANTGARNIVPGGERRELKYPILPKDNERNILITSALPYVNNVPHLGNIIGSVLSADIYARYAKARNYNTLFVCGTDEYGTATETKAIEEGVTPKELCDKYFKIHSQVYEWFQIGFDKWGRTSTPEQTKIAQDIFLKVNKNDYLEEQTSEQLYCTVHNAFLADRFVEGTCPKCGYDDARGDQCDSCGTLLNPFELIKPRCKLDGSSPEVRQTSHIYLCLDKLQDQIADWNKVAQEKGKWSKNGRQITQNWLKEGLKPRAITRDLKWGVPVPLEKYKDKVFYVWFDACIGYVSITATYTEEWEKWWKDPEHVQLYQFMGKDNVPFHTVVFPGTQFGTKENWTMLHHLSTTEYLQYEGGKFSKSRNLGVFGNNAQEIGISPSVWRYYLATARPESSDTAFSWQDFVSRNNSELLANFGNFVNRVVKFSIAKYNGVVPEFQTSSIPDYSTFYTEVNALLSKYNTAMEAVSLRQGLEIAMQISARGNQFLQDNKLDNSLFDNSPEKCAAVVGVALNLIYLLSAVFCPFMPQTAEEINVMLNAPHPSIPNEFSLRIVGGHCIGKAKYLFKKIEEDKVDEWKQRFGGN